MSSVQGPQQVTSGALDRIRTQLDQLAGSRGKSNTGALIGLKQQLERNVKNADVASDLTRKLNEDERKVLAQHVATVPQLRELFKDSLGYLYDAGKDVNNKDFGKARTVRAQAGSTQRVADGQMVTPASLKGKIEGEPVGATSGASAKRTAEPSKVRKLEETAKADAETGVASAPSNAAKGDATGPKRQVRIIDDLSPQAGGTEPAEKVKAANTDAVDVAADADKVAGAGEVDGERTASGAKRMPPSLDEIFQHAVDKIHEVVSPKTADIVNQARQYRDQLAYQDGQISMAEERLRELKAIPAAERKPEEKKEISTLSAALKTTSKIDIQNEFEKVAAFLAEVPSKVGLLASYYGLKHRLEGQGADKPGRAMDLETKEGRETLAVWNEIFGRESDLPPEMKAKIADFRKTPEGQQMLEMAPSITLYDALNQGRLDGSSPEIQRIIKDVEQGKFVEENTVRKLLGMPSKEEEQAMKAAAGGNGGQVPPGGGGIPPTGPTDPGNKWFNASNKNWFGLSRVRHDQLKNDGHHELLQAIQDYNIKQQTMHMSQTTRLHSMMALLNSGLPIESILLMFMGLMTENEEEKLKLKMAEIVVGEQFERVNRKLQADQNFARDLYKKYGSAEVAAAQRENINKEQIEKMAGLEWTKAVTPEEAFRDTARGRLFDSLRSRGIGADKLEKLTFKDGKLDPEAVKELNLNPEDIARAEITDEASLEAFKVKAVNLSDGDIEELKNKKVVQSEARFIDVTLNPSDFGFTNKPSQALVQELQVQMQNYKQIMETFTAVIRMLQDIVSRITQNIR